MGKILTTILAGAFALGLAGCEKEKKYSLEMEGRYICQANMGDEVQDNVIVTKNEQVIGAKLIVKNCEGDNCMPPVSYMAYHEEGNNDFFYVISEDGTPDPLSAKTPQAVERCKKAHKLVRECEQLLEQKYKKDF